MPNIKKYYVGEGGYLCVWRCDEETKSINDYPLFESQLDAINHGTGVFHTQYKEKIRNLIGSYEEKKSDTSENDNS